MFKILTSYHLSEVIIAGSLNQHLFLEPNICIYLKEQFHFSGYIYGNNNGYTQISSVMMFLNTVFPTTNKSEINFQSR